MAIKGNCSAPGGGGGEGKIINPKLELVMTNM